MTQSAAPAAPKQPPPSSALGPQALTAVRETVLTLLTTDEEILGKVRAALAAQGGEIGAHEAEQILDLVAKQVQPVIDAAIEKAAKSLDKEIERVVRSLVRPDYLLRPHLRPDQVV
jgi:hypothetical protein